MARSFHFRSTRFARYILGWLLMLAILCRPAAGAEPPRDVLPPALDTAIDRGLTFLQKQQKTDGSFETSEPPAAMAGLAILAFLASGNTPDVGKYGLTVRKAVDYLLNLNPEGGYFGRDRHGMYSHCIVTIALAEVHGTEADETQRRRVRLTLEKALKVIYAAQDAKKEKDIYIGGWRYEPQSADSDLSVTAWCMVALRACNNAGIPVPKNRVDRAAKYMMTCYRADQKGFAYQAGRDASPAMTAAALLSLQPLEVADTQILEAGAKFLTEKPVKQDTQYYYYGLYHTTQAAYQAGQVAWPIVWKNSYEQLLPKQRKEDGSWPVKREEAGGDDKKGRVYSTSMAVLTLSIPLSLLPMYQR